MTRILLASACIMILCSACGPRYYIPSDSAQPGRVVVSAYTQGGCVEELKEEAKQHGIEVKLKDIQSDLGRGILLWPFYKSYKCTGKVIGSAK